MTEQEILEIKISNMTIKSWLDYFATYHTGYFHYNIFEDNGHIQIKASIPGKDIYSEIFYGHYTDFEVFINAMKFFRQMFRQH